MFQAATAAKLKQHNAGITSGADASNAGPDAHPCCCRYLRLHTRATEARKPSSADSHLRPAALPLAATAGSVGLAGTLLKTCVCGLIRFALPLFAQQLLEFAPIAIALGVAGIISGAVLASAHYLLAYICANLATFALVDMLVDGGESNDCEQFTALSELFWRQPILVLPLILAMLR